MPSAAAWSCCLLLLGDVPRSPLSPHPQAVLLFHGARPPSRPGSERPLPETSTGLPCGVNFHLRLLGKDRVVRWAPSPGPLHALRWASGKWHCCFCFFSF